MSRTEINRLMVIGSDNLADAQYLFNDKRYSGVPNRSYYAVFDAVNALLRTHEQYTKTHKGAKSKFNELFIKTGKMPQEANTWLEECAELRQSGDYDFEHDVTEEQARKSIDYANEFLLHAEAYLRGQNLLD